MQQLNNPISEKLLPAINSNTDVLIPVAFGEVFNVTPIKSSTIVNTLTYQVHTDNIEDIIEVRDTKGNLTKSTYDDFGRRTRLEHPDSGISTYEYDLVGNLISRKNAKNQTVTYDYDFSRLKAVNYPDFPENNVKYFYGNAKDQAAMDNNAVGRLTYQTDATGT